MSTAPQLAALALDALTARIAIIDRAGTIVAVNESWRAFVQALEIGLDDAGIGASYVEHFGHLLGDASVTSDFERTLDRILAEQLGSRTWEYAVCPRGEASRRFLMRLDRFPGDGARNAVVSHEDITELRAAEEALRRSEQRHRTVVETSPDFILQVSRSGLISYINRRELPGAPGAVVGSSILEWVAPEHRQAMAAALEASAGEEGLRTLDLHSPGVDAPLHFRCRMRRATSGSSTDELVLYLTDTSAQRRIEAALAESENRLRHSQRMEAIGTLAGGVAHDFNNLLSVVFSYADSLAADLPDDPAMREDIMGITRAAERAAALTRQLLAFSSRQVLKFETTTVNRIVSSMEKMLRRLLREDIELSIELAADPGVVRVDVGQIEQVVMNLVVNAADAMPEGGSLRIATSREALGEDTARRLGVKPGEYSRLDVEDSGHGMDENTLAHIFEPFFTTKGLGHGTGLGLATVFGIVHQSEGHIDVESTPGHGAHFIVHLPTTTHRARITESASATRARVRPHRRVSVFVVEDDAPVRFALRRLLSRAGYAVTIAGNGREALDAAQEHDGPIDVLLTDVVMPAMDGAKLSDELRLTHPALRTVFMTGYVDDAATRRRLADHADPVIVKPFSPDDLLEAIRRAIV